MKRIVKSTLTGNTETSNFNVNDFTITLGDTVLIPKTIQELASFMVPLLFEMGGKRIIFDFESNLKESPFCIASVYEGNDIQEWSFYLNEYELSNFNGGKTT